MDKRETDPQRQPAPERSDDPLVGQEERAAAAEAGQIGGPAPETEGDEATRPLEEGGQGEAEGFEQAERGLVEQASHGENRSDPEADAFPAEEASSTESYGEPDQVDPTEVVSDPAEGPEDPGEGPGLAPDR